MSTGTLEPDRIRAAKLDAQILDLERSLSTLQAQRELVQKRLDSYKYLVLTLPNEITAEIFGHCLPNYPECPVVNPTCSPINLTQICRDWRDIALATPTLWRAIELYFGRIKGARPVRELETWLSRSGRCPMSVGLTMVSDYKFSSAHCARWEVLKIYLPASHLPITEASMPLLRQLDLTVTSYLGIFNLVLFGEAPLLTSAILNHLAAKSVVLPWAQLTSMEHLMCPPNPSS